MPIPQYRIVLTKEQPAATAQLVALQQRGPSGRESRSNRARPVRARVDAGERGSLRATWPAPPDDRSCVGACWRRASHLAICEAAPRPAEVAPDELEICAVLGNRRQGRS